VCTQGFSPNGGTTDERHSNFQLCALVTGGRRKHSSIRAGRKREKRRSTSGQARGTTAREDSSGPNEAICSADARAARSPTTPAESGSTATGPSKNRSATICSAGCSTATARSADFTKCGTATARSADFTKCGTAPARSAACADTGEQTYADTGQHTSASRPRETLGTTRVPSRRCSAATGSD
jgi:hypothetical protein